MGFQEPRRSLLLRSSSSDPTCPQLLSSQELRLMLQLRQLSSNCPDLDSMLMLLLRLLFSLLKEELQLTSALVNLLITRLNRLSLPPNKTFWSKDKFVLC